MIRARSTGSRRRTPLLLLARRVVALAAVLCAALLLARPPALGPDVAAADAPATAPSALTPPLGAVLVPLRLTDPAVAGLLAVGDHVDLYAGEPGLPLQLVRSGLLVARVIRPPSSALADGGPLVVIAATAAQAADVVAVASAGIVVVTLVPLDSAGGHGAADPS